MGQSPVSSPCAVENSEQLEGLTHNEVANFSFTWTLDNYSFYELRKGDSITSKEQICRGDLSSPNLSCYLKVYPNGDHQSCADMMSIRMVIRGMGDLELDYNLKVKYTLYLLNLEKNFVKISSASTTTPHHEFGIQFNQKELCDAKSGYLLDDKLTIRCDFSMVIKNETTLQMCNAVTIPDCSLGEDLGLLYKSQMLTDVKFTVNNVELRAHKAILAARSPVFLAMFTSDLKYLFNSNVIKIEDITETVFEEMLTYIYTGKVADLDSVAYGLIVAADKYCLARLKKMCEESLIKTLTPQNSVDYVILADLLSVDTLKKKAAEMIIKSKSEIDIDSHRVLLASHPHLFTEIFLKPSLLEPSSN